MTNEAEPHAEPIDTALKAAGHGVVEGDCMQFRDYLMQGVMAKPAGRMDADYFAALRRRVMLPSRTSS